MSAATNCPRTWPASASADIPNAATAAATSSERGCQESIPTRPITGRSSTSTIERRVRFMTVKVGDSLVDLTKAVALSHFGRRKAVHRGR